MWRCPLCKEPLQTQIRTWKCENNHTFDVSKRGYVNLLPVQFKKSKQPGDDKEMLDARRYFHSRQSYLPLMSSMAKGISNYIEKNQVYLYDAGCGEGTYLNQIANFLATKYSVIGAGSDIAKPAVDLAAKQYKDFQFTVASSVSLPLVNDSIDVMLQVFAPGKDQEFYRVLSNNGLLVIVGPGSNHLQELKNKLYREAKPHIAPTQEKQNFRLVRTEQLSYAFQLDDIQHAKALLKMTPYYWKLTQQAAATLPNELLETKITADFVIQIWQKHSA